MHHEIYTYTLEQFKKKFPNISIPPDIDNDNSYYVRIGHKNGINGIEIEFSPDPEVWEYVK